MRTYDLTTRSDGRRRLTVVATTCAMLATAILIRPEIAAAAGSNAGGGIITGSVVYAGTGLPPLGASCRATNFTVSGSSESVVVNTVVSAYAGPITITGPGASACETTSLGGGTLTIAATGTGPTGSTISCPSLVGGFTRTATDATVILGGSCTINNFATSNVSFVAKVEFQPSNSGGGVTTPTTAGTFEGVVAIAPA